MCQHKICETNDQNSNIQSDNTSYCFILPKKKTNKNKQNKIKRISSFAKVNCAGDHEEEDKTLPTPTQHIN